MVPPQSSRISLPTALLEAGRRAIIMCPVDERAWPTRIAQTSTQDAVTVFAPRDVEGPIRRFPGSLLTIEIPTEHALYRLPGTLLEQAETGSPLWKLGEFRELIRVQRRASHRFKGNFDAALAIRPKGRPVEECPLPPGLPRNLSSTGCYLQTPAPVAIGTTVQVALRLDPRHVWTLNGEVVRTEAPAQDLTGIGILFQDPDREAQQAIVKYITAAERRPHHANLLA